MNIAEEISAYAASLAYRDFDQLTIDTVKKRVVDSLACALGSLNSTPITALQNFAKTVPVHQSTIIGSSRKTTPDIAALVNGSMVRYLDYNDGYIGKELGHPSDNIPACLAVAEAEGKTGPDLILAIVLAYEIQCRLQDAACLYKLGWDHANYVLISSTIGAGKLMGLDQHQLTQALNIAINGHISLRQARAGELSMWKGCSAANAARNGVFSAMLARQGLTGPSPIFEGEMGFIKQISNSLELDTATFGSKGNGDFAIKRSLTKLLPTQGEIQTAVWAGLKLRKRISNIEQIKSIHVATTHAAYRITASDPEKWRPKTRETADHSLPFTLARALLDGEITPNSYADKKLEDPAAISLMAKISASEDPALTDMFPQYIANRVTITLTSGEVLEEQVNTARGGRPDLPMSNEDFEHKFKQATKPHINLKNQQTAIDFVWKLDEKTHFGTLFKALET
ncbi:MAG: MmgE/PrpD family protein [Spongiibacteraceae bacterium]|nr:MmgE/PrpD family protein [Spongiibacteraceae bacterium]